MSRKLKGKRLSTKSLRNALLNQQKRNVDEHSKKKASSSPSSKAHVKQERKFVPFDKESTLMLIGEGDFSFARSVVNEGYIRPKNLIVTSFDSGPDELVLKYPNSFTDNEQYLQDKGVRIMYGVDGTDMLKTFKISNRNTWSKIVQNTRLSKIDNIMFNFPHNGKGIKDVERNVMEHQEMMQQFFQNCRALFQLMGKDHPGKVIVSLFEGEPYDSWRIKKLAQAEKLQTERSGKFQWSTFPGYQHRRTNNEWQTTKPAGTRPARIYIFSSVTHVTTDKQ